MQPAPAGALCAQHPGVPASITCTRCGNFMCTTCSEGGAAAVCPPCRALTADSFPFKADASLGDLWNHCVEVFKRDPAMLVVGAVVFFGITMAGSIVAQIISTVVNAIGGFTVDQRNPGADWGKFAISLVVAQVVSTLVQVVVQAIAISGYYRLLMDALIGRKADIGRMFSTLKDLGKYVTLQVLLFVAVTVPLMVFVALVTFVGLRSAGFDFSHPSSFKPEMLFTPAVIGLLAGTTLILVVLAVVLLPVTLFAVPELIVGKCTPMEAIQRTWALGDGQRLRVLGYSFVMGAVVLAGVMACCVGVLAAMPLSYMLLLALFLALRNSSNLPPADHS